MPKNTKQKITSAKQHGADKVVSIFTNCIHSITRAVSATTGMSDYVGKLVYLTRRICNHKGKIPIEQRNGLSLLYKKINLNK